MKSCSSIYLLLLYECKRKNREEKNALANKKNLGKWHDDNSGGKHTGCVEWNGSAVARAPIFQP